MVIIPPCKVNLTQKDFRASLHKPSSNYKVKEKGPRLVPAFTIQSLQKNTVVIPPPKTGVFKKLKLKSNVFQRSYDKGDLPLSIEFTARGNRLLWSVPIEKIDICYYLCLLLSGLGEGRYPYNFIVENGIKDLVAKAAHKILPCIPQLIPPIREALQTKNPKVVLSANNCLKRLVMNVDNFGIALVSYYRQILPVMALFLSRTRPTNLDETIITDKDLWYSIEDTLNVFERYGGPDAFINIKYFIPHYQSCVLN